MPDGSLGFCARGRLAQLRLVRKIKFGDPVVRRFRSIHQPNDLAELDLRHMRDSTRHIDVLLLVPPLQLFNICWMPVGDDQLDHLSALQKTANYSEMVVGDPGLEPG